MFHARFPHAEYLRKTGKRGFPQKYVPSGCGIRKTSERPTPTSIGVLLLTLIELDVDLFVRRGRVQWRDTKDALTFPIAQAIRRFEPEIIDLLEIIPGSLLDPQKGDARV